MKPPRVVGYYYCATSDPKRATQNEAAIHALAAKLNLPRVQVLSDRGTTRRAGRRAALAAIRTGQARVLLVPGLWHLAPKSLRLIDVVDAAFGGFRRGRLVTCDGSFDSSLPNGKSCWGIFRAVAELEAEISYQRDGVTLH